MSHRKCCVPGCVNKNNVVLHKFPDPEKFKELFNIWLYSIGGDLLQLDNNHIFKYRNVCHVHFENKYWCRNNRISKNAVPTQNMPEGVTYPKQSLNLSKENTNTTSENEHNSLITLEIEPEFVNIKLEIDTFDATVKQEHALDSDEDAKPLSLHKHLSDSGQPTRVTNGQIFEVEIKQEPIEVDFEPNTQENQHFLERSFQDQTLVEEEEEGDIGDYMTSEEAGPSRRSRRRILESAAGSSSRTTLTSPIRRKRSTTLSVGEQKLIINIYKYVRSTWPEDTYLSNDKIMEKISEISGVSKRTIYRILAEYRDTHSYTGRKRRNEKKKTIN